MSAPLPAGSIVQCPGCGLDLFTLERDLFQGETLRVEAFSLIGSVPAPSPGALMRCYECGHPYYRGQLHIKGKGWV